MVRKFMLIISKNIIEFLLFIQTSIHNLFFNLYAHSLTGAEVNITSKTEFNNILNYQIKLSKANLQVFFTINKREISWITH